MNVPNVTGLSLQQAIEEVYKDLSSKISFHDSDRRSAVQDQIGQVRTIEDTGTASQKIKVRFKNGWVTFPSENAITNLLRKIEVDGEPLRQIIRQTIDQDIEDGEIPLPPGTGTYVPTSRVVGTDAPLSGGGTLTSDLILSLSYSDPLTLSGGNLTVNVSDPVEISGDSIGVKEHAENQSGVISAGAQSIWGDKTFRGQVRINTAVLKSPGQLRVEESTSTTLRNIVIAQATNTNHALTAGRTLQIASDSLNVLTWNHGSAVNLVNDITWTPSLAVAGLSQAGILNATTQDIDGKKKFITGLELNDTAEFSSNTFTPGFDGNGFKFYRDSGLWKFELDDLFIRGSLFANEFIINQISALNGSDILSPGRGKIEEIVDTNIWTVSDPKGGNYASFAVDDIVMIQQVRPDIIPGNPTSGQIIKRIVRVVSNVNGNVIQLSNYGSGGPADSGFPEVGDVVVAIGNRTNTNRQSNIYRSVIDSGSPFVRVNTGVSSWNDWTNAYKRVLQYGNLAGIDFKGVSLSGFGIWAKGNIYLDIGNNDGIAIGSNVGGTGNNGIMVNSTNYWYGNGNFQLWKSNDERLSFIDGTFDLRAQNFDLKTPTLQLSSTTSKLVMGVNAQTQALNNGNGLYADGTGDIRFGRATSGVLLRGLKYSETTELLTMKTKNLDVDESLEYDLLDTFGNESTINSGITGSYDVSEIKYVTITMPDSGIAITRYSYRVDETLPVYDFTQNFMYVIQTSIQGKRVDDGIWENIAWGLGADKTVQYIDPCEGQEQDPCNQIFNDVKDIVFAFPSPKYDEYRIEITNGSADKLFINQIGTRPIQPKSTVHSEGITTSNIQIIQRIQIRGTSNDYCDLIYRRATNGQNQLVLLNYRNGDYIGETVLSNV